MFLVSHCSGPRGTRPRAVDCGATYSFALARLSNIIFINRKAYFHTFTQTQKSPKLSCCEGFSPKREKSGGTSSSLALAAAVDGVRGAAGARGGASNLTRPYMVRM